MLAFSHCTSYRRVYPSTLTFVSVEHRSRCPPTLLAASRQHPHASVFHCFLLGSGRTTSNGKLRHPRLQTVEVFPVSGCPGGCFFVSSNGGMDYLAMLCCSGTSKMKVVVFSEHESEILMFRITMANQAATFSPKADQKPSGAGCWNEAIFRALNPPWCLSGLEGCPQTILYTVLRVVSGFQVPSRRKPFEISRASRYKNLCNGRKSVEC